MAKNTLKEEKWTVSTSDGFKIYGVKSFRKPKATSAIFMVHGLTSTMHDYAFKRAADFFSTKHDVYRFNLYDGEKGARMMRNCTLRTHADDLDTVLKKFGKKYKHIFLIGHSYGGPTIMLSKMKGVTAVSLWDPPFDLKTLRTKHAEIFETLGNYYVINWGTSCLMSIEMFNQDLRLDEKACIELSKKCPCPLQVINAADSFYVKQPLSWHSYCKHKHKREYIKGTAHCFHEGNTCDELLKKTDKWFRRFA